MPATTSLLTAKAVVRFTADQMENRPPTQSQSLKIWVDGTPHWRAASGLAVTATICPSGSQTLAALSHSRARLALSRVSAVAKDLEAMTTKVSCGSRLARPLAMAWPSMFETKRTLRQRLV